MMPKSIEEYVDEFAKLIMLKHEADDVEEGNKYALKSAKAFRELVKHYGDAGREALTGLFNHEHRRVRSISAAFLLRHAHDEAWAVLEKLAEGDDFPAFGARQTMKNWHNGDWQLDLED